MPFPFKLIPCSIWIALYHLNFFVVQSAMKFDMFICILYILYVFNSMCSYHFTIEKVISEFFFNVFHKLSDTAIEFIKLFFS